MEIEKFMETVATEIESKTGATIRVVKLKHPESEQKPNDYTVVFFNDYSYLLSCKVDLNSGLAYAMDCNGGFYDCLNIVNAIHKVLTENYEG